MTQTPLLSEIERFLDATGMAASTFGQKAVHQWRLVENLRDGGDVTTRTADRIRTFIAEHPASKPAPRRPSSRAAA